MLKKNRVILLCLLALTGCSNSATKAKEFTESMETYIEKELNKSIETCLEQNSEHSCILNFEYSVWYNEENDIFGVRITENRDIYSLIDPTFNSAAMFRIVEESEIKSDVLIFEDSKYISAEGVMYNINSYGKVGATEPTEWKELMSLFRRVGVDPTLYWEDFLVERWEETESDK